MEELKGSFTLKQISEAFFGESINQTYPSQSNFMSKSGTEMAKVIKSTYQWGYILKNLDPEETIFHVELYPAEINQENPPHHSELWIAHEWARSNKNYETRKAVTHAKNRETLLREELGRNLAEDLAIKHMPEQDVNAFCKTISNNFDKHDLTPLLKSLELEHVIEDFLKEYPNENCFKQKEPEPSAAA